MSLRFVLKISDAASLHLKRHCIKCGSIAKIDVETASKYKIKQFPRFEGLQKIKGKIIKK
jgi:hypothetical protein